MSSIDIGALYYDYVESRLSVAARKLLEETVELNGYQWQGEFARRHIAEGESRGVARGVLIVLAERGIEVSDEVRERITSCTDTAQLELWLRRVVTVETAERLFG